MMCYLDQTFCDRRDCATDCERRFFGTTHEENAKHVGLPVSCMAMKDSAYCKGYTTKEVTPCSASDANPVR